MVVFAISVHDVPPFVEVCHLIIDPVSPLKVIVPPFEVPHTEGVVVAVVPPTEATAQQVGAIKSTGLDG